MMSRREIIRSGAALAAFAALAAGSAFARPPLKLTPTTFPHKPGVTGRYDVYAAWDAEPSATMDARFTVKHAKGTCCYSQCQQYWYPRHFLGTFELDADSEINMTSGSTSGGKLLPTQVFLEPTAKRALWHVAEDGFFPVTLNAGDSVFFRSMRGPGHTFELVSTFAQVEKRDEKTGNILSYRWGAELTVDKKPLRIERVTPSTRDNFASPFEYEGTVVWLDAVQDIFEDCGGFMSEKDADHGLTCRPKRQARLVLRDECVGFAPDGRILPWFPGSERPHNVEICFQGRNTWMGTWQRNSTHGGLDINMPSGSILTCPIDVDDQELFHSIRHGADNNRWRATRRWNEKETWWIISNHLNKLLVPEHKPVKAGTPYADAAGAWVWEHEHVHFDFRVFRFEGGKAAEDFWLDPWILMRAAHPLAQSASAE